MSEQGEQLQRVSEVIGGAILAYRSRVGVGGEFHAEELRTFVIEQHPQIAPDSPSRILRMLRRRGDLDYVVVHRASSLYRFTA